MLVVVVVVIVVVVVVVVVAMIVWILWVLDPGSCGSWILNPGILDPLDLGSSGSSGSWMLLSIRPLSFSPFCLPPNQVFGAKQSSCCTCPQV